MDILTLLHEMATSNHLNAHAAFPKKWTLSRVGNWENFFPLSKKLIIDRKSQMDTLYTGTSMLAGSILARECRLHSNPQSVLPTHPNENPQLFFSCQKTDYKSKITNGHALHWYLHACWQHTGQRMQGSRVTRNQCYQTIRMKIRNFFFLSKNWL